MNEAELKLRDFIKKLDRISDHEYDKGNWKGGREYYNLSWEAQEILDLMVKESAQAL